MFENIKCTLVNVQVRKLMHEDAMTVPRGSGAASLLDKLVEFKYN